MNQDYTMKRHIVGQNGVAIFGIEAVLPVGIRGIGSLFVDGEFDFSYGHASTRRAGAENNVGRLSVQPISFSLALKGGLYFTKKSAIYGLLGTTNVGLHYKDKAHYTRQMFSARTVVFFSGVGVKTSFDGITFINLECRWAPQSGFTAKPSKNVADATAGFVIWALKDSSCRIGWTSIMLKVTTRFLF